jgi:hypothetical protein
MQRPTCAGGQDTPESDVIRSAGTIEAADVYARCLPVCRGAHAPRGRRLRVGTSEKRHGSLLAMPDSACRAMLYAPRQTVRPERHCTDLVAGGNGQDSAHRQHRGAGNADSVSRYDLLAAQRHLRGFRDLPSGAGPAGSHARCLHFCSAQARGPGPEPEAAAHSAILNLGDGKGPGADTLMRGTLVLLDARCGCLR